MSLVLARCLEDPAGLLAELEVHWRAGALVGLATPQEREALLSAVLGRATGTSVQHTSHPHPSGQPHPGEGAANPDLLQQGPALVLGSGGSSGGRRWCLQPLSHLEASAQACGDWLSGQGSDPERSLHLNALPLHHVSGLMPLIRARQWRSELRWLPPQLLRRPDRLPEACPLPTGRPVLLSLVPTQLGRLLSCPVATRWLAGCAVVWVGGSALSEGLAARARAAALPLAPCYGATETAAMVCALPPDRFRAGDQGCGPPLADVELRLEGMTGAIAVRSPRISPGWFEAGRLRPFTDTDGWWRSGDAGAWCGRSPGSEAGIRELPPGATRQAAHASHSLVIHGRLDDAINSGGETVFPEQVRQRLLALIESAALPVAELLVLGEADPDWGERLVALVRWRDSAVERQPVSGDIPPATRASQSRWLRQLSELARALPPPQRPHRWLPCPELTSEATGKWQRQQWRTWLERNGAEKT